MKREVVLLTIEYPDPLLDRELPFLIDAFDAIHILPDRINGQVPIAIEKVRIAPIFNHVSPNLPGWFVLKHLTFIIRLYHWAILKSGFAKVYLRHWKSFFGYLIQEAEKIRPLKKYIEQNKLSNAIFYDFWLVNTTLALAELKRRHLIKRSVARVHGFDLYAERFSESIVPFQEYRIRYLDAVFAISQHGLEYLKSRLPVDVHPKLMISYLGVTANPGVAPQVKSRIEHTIVSCSSLIPLKRVDLLIAALKLTTLDICWIHFGSGPQYAELQEAIKALPANVRTEFKGHVENPLIMDFYRDNYIDLFVSVSEREGLPVSMMEAASHGIPILACDIYAVPEIVMPGTGVLVSKNPYPKEVSEAIEQACHMAFDRDYIKRSCLEKFSAKVNYSNFINNLIKICERGRT